MLFIRSICLRKRVSKYAKVRIFFETLSPDAKFVGRSAEVKFQWVCANLYARSCVSM